MAGRLDGKIAFVTGSGCVGSGWGNGKAISVLFAREGARVFGVDLAFEAAEATRKLIEQEGGSAISFKADVSKSEDVRRAVQGCIGTYGRVDVLVNNVGILSLGGTIETTEADWDRVHDVNLKSVFLTSKEVLPSMISQGRGSIINIASLAAHRYLGIPYASYYSSKSALIGYTRSVALEHAERGIRANTVSPGLMNTPMVHTGLTRAYGEDGDIDNLIRTRDAQCPSGKMGDAWDVAHACLFLASDEANYVNAIDLPVDGGISAKAG